MHRAMKCYFRARFQLTCCRGGLQSSAVATPASCILAADQALTEWFPKQIQGAAPSVKGKYHSPAFDSSHGAVRDPQLTNKATHVAQGKEG